jgi:uncharacterized membrane protein YsdA (DUF1294 family)
MKFTIHVFSKCLAVHIDWRTPLVFLLFCVFILISMGVWQGMAMDSRKLLPGPPCPTLLSPVAPETPETAF